MASPVEPLRIQMSFSFAFEVVYIGAGFKRYTVGAGTAVILPGGVQRRVRIFRMYRGTEFFWVHFRGEIGTLPRREASLTKSV